MILKDGGEIMAKSQGVNKNSTVTTTELAGIMGLTPRRLQQLVKDGLLETVEEGVFLLGESVQRYATYIKGGDKSEEERKLDLEKKRAEVRMKKARARREELETLELDGNMHRSEDVQALTDDFIYTVKGSIMSLPSRVCTDVAAEKDPAACADIVKKECRAILTECSQFEYDPEKYRDRVRERKQMELQFMGLEDEAEL